MEVREIQEVRPRWTKPKARQEVGDSDCKEGTTNNMNEVTRGAREATKGMRVNVDECSKAVKLMGGRKITAKK